MPATAPYANKILSGTIKSYDRRRGFGFVAVYGHDDVFFLESTALEGGMRIVTEGSPVKLEAVHRPQGWQAIRMSSLSAPQQPSPGDWQRCALKWWNTVKGYGFLDTDQGDAFLHARVVSAAGLIGLRPGQVFEAKLGTSNDGRLFVSEIRATS